MAKFQKKVSVGQFVKPGDLKDGDVVTIANEGKKIQGTFGEQDVFLIKLPNGEEKNVNLNQTSLNALIDAYGDDSINWIGKIAKVWFLKMMVSGKMCNVKFFSHPLAKMNDDGSFSLPKDGVDTKPKDDDEVNPDDIPF